MFNYLSYHNVYVNDVREKINTNEKQNEAYNLQGSIASNGTKYPPTADKLSVFVSTIFSSGFSNKNKSTIRGF